MLQQVFFQWICVSYLRIGHGRKTYNNGVCIKRSTSSELEVDYYGRLEEVVELQYHSE
jgi:hypothetical protein